MTSEGSTGVIDTMSTLTTSSVNFDQAINNYGLLSIVGATLFPGLWNFAWKGSENMDSTGFKVAAYVNLVFFAPFAGAFLLHLISGKASVTA